MPVLIHGQTYSTVAERIAEITAKDELKSVETLIVSKMEDDFVVVRAVITTNKGTFVGHAEERRGKVGIGGESPIEVAETSAVGRALAFAGYIGNVKIKAIASADEMKAKLGAQATPEATPEPEPTKSTATQPEPVKEPKKDAEKPKATKDEPKKAEPIKTEDVKKMFDGKVVIECQGCAKLIEDYQGFKAEQIASFSKRKFGKELCIPCQRNAQQEAKKASKK